MALSTGELYVDLHAIVQNWQTICASTQDVKVGAVVKANAYGLGVERVAPALMAAGCDVFYVANIKEAVQLRALLDRESTIFVLGGVPEGAEQECVRHSLIPVLISTAMVERWLGSADLSGYPCAIKVDTGMGRLGVSPSYLHANLARLSASSIHYLFGHLACADSPGHPKNVQQLNAFNDVFTCLKDLLPNLKASLANSAGIALGQSYHFNLVRPGVALYGGAVSGLAIRPVVSLSLPILQLKVIAEGGTVGYGATYAAPKGGVTIAIVAGGYADGVMRSLSNRGVGYIAGKRVSMVGRVSMDTCAFDVTNVPPGNVSEGGVVEILNSEHTIDLLAKEADTIGYEVLTSFGGRYQRCYIG